MRGYKNWVLRVSRDELTDGSSGFRPGRPGTGSVTQRAWSGTMSIGTLPRVLKPLVNRLDWAVSRERVLSWLLHCADIPHIRRTGWRIF